MLLYKFKYWILFITFLFQINNTNAQKLEAEFLYKITLFIDAPIDAGKSPFGTKIAYPIKGGTFDGPKMKGKVLAVGEDWLTKIDEKTNKLDVRIMLETEDMEIIACTYTGIVRINEDKSVYWRITPTFQTNSIRYNWLNYTLAVGKCSFENGNVTYEVYALK